MVLEVIGLLEQERRDDAAPKSPRLSHRLVTRMRVRQPNGEQRIQPAADDGDPNIEQQRRRPEDAGGDGCERTAASATSQRRSRRA